jgi:hypothetical protein
MILGIFQGASEAGISEWIFPERATRKNAQKHAALRVGMKMAVLRCYQWVDLVEGRNDAREIIS